VIWQANAIDAMGHVTSDSMAANAFTDTRQYDVLGRLHTVQAGSGNTIQNDIFDYDPVGNLHDRSWIDSSGGSHSESLGYDPLNRLTSVTGPANKAFSYDGAGNLTYKSDVGTYSYTPGTHQISNITAGSATLAFGYDGNGNVVSGGGPASTWTSFNMPATLTRGTNASSFFYGPEYQRIEQIASSTGGTVTTFYIASNFERVATSATGITENHFYITAGGRRVAMLVDASNAITSWRYFHQDHLSSVEVVTDQSSALVERLSYDAWGKRRNLDGTDSATAITAIDTRGFTDQEELDNLGVVHMNGRLYASVLGRFISPDPIIQNAYDPQNHNRYSYTLNRPLSLIDPSGYIPRGGGSFGVTGGTLGVGATTGAAGAYAGFGGGCVSCGWSVIVAYVARAGADSSTDPLGSGPPAGQLTRNAPGVRRATGKAGGDDDTPPPDGIPDEGPSDPTPGVPISPPGSGCIPDIPCFPITGQRIPKSPPSDYPLPGPDPNVVPSPSGGGGGGGGGGGPTAKAPSPQGQQPTQPKQPCDQPSSSTPAPASSGKQLSTGVQFNMSTVVGSGTSSGVSYQSVPGSTTSSYKYSGPGVGFDPGLSLQSVWAWGSGTWTGTFQSVNFAASFFAGSVFWTPGQGGWAGFTFGLAAGPPGASFTETNYTCNGP